MRWTRLSGCALMTLRAMAQPPVVVRPPEPRFELRTDNPSPNPKMIAGSASSTRMAGVVATVTHRYFFDESDHTYFGYDVVIQPDGGQCL